MPALLQAPGHAGWPHLQRLLLALLRFMEPYLRNADLIEAVRVLYKVRDRKAPLVSENHCSTLPGNISSQGWRWPAWHRKPEALQPRLPVILPKYDCISMT